VRSHACSATGGGGDELINRKRETIWQSKTRHQ